MLEIPPINNKWDHMSENISVSTRTTTVNRYNEHIKTRVAPDTDSTRKPGTGWDKTSDKRTNANCRVDRSQPYPGETIMRWDKRHWVGMLSLPDQMNVLCVVVVVGDWHLLLQHSFLSLHRVSRNSYFQMKTSNQTKGIYHFCFFRGKWFGTIADGMT